MGAKLVVSGFILLVLSLGVLAEQCFYCGSDVSGNPCGCSKQAKSTELYVSAQEALQPAVKMTQNDGSPVSLSYDNNGGYYVSDSGSSYALPSSPGYVELCKHKTEQTNELRSPNSHGSASPYGSASSYGSEKQRVIVEPRYIGSDSGMVRLAPVNPGKASCSCESCSSGSTSTSPQDSPSSAHPLILTLAPAQYSSSSSGSGSDSIAAPIQAPLLPVAAPATYAPLYQTSYTSSYQPSAQPMWRTLAPAPAAVAKVAAQSTGRTSILSRSAGKLKMSCRRHGGAFREPLYENIAAGDFASSSWPGYGFNQYNDLTAPCECTS